MAVSLLAPLGAGAPAAAACVDRAAPARDLAEIHGERLAGIGETRMGVLELWIGARSWTLLLTLPDGRACPVAAGRDWRPIFAEKQAIGFFIEDDPETRFCCGEADCRPAKGRTRYTPDGWAVTGAEGFKKRGDHGFFENKPTRDGGPWVCVTPANRIRCLILPETRT